MSARVFEESPAVRGKVPLLIGLVGPSSAGKTYSALRLAGGIQRVTGGDVKYLDTEAKRALHYRDKFRFRHFPFAAPFGPLDYLDGIEQLLPGAGVIIVDSMSHEHEGPGGVLERHAEEHHRLGGKETTKMLAWAKPKAERRRLINSLLQMEANFIFCFRAKEKVKLATREEKADGEKPVQQLGFMPIAGEEFIYEMTVNALLLPGAEGVPTWKSNEPGERMMIKLPEQFRKLLLEHKGPLDEELGAAMATWAAGDTARAQGSADEADTLAAKIAAAASMAELDQLTKEANGKRWGDDARKRIRDALVTRKETLGARPA